MAPTSLPSSILEKSKSPKTLTFGVELEFILAYPRSCSKKDLWAVRDTYIRQPLLAAGISVSDRTQSIKVAKGKQKFDMWHVTDDKSVYTTEAQLKAIDYTFANGVRKGSDEKLRYSSVEVISPVLPLTVDSLKEVQRVVSVIRSQRTFTPPSAGLHVHVGYGTRGFSLPVLQNLLVLMTCFEPQLNQAFPEHRQGNFFCASLQKSMFNPQERARLDMAEEIYMFSTLVGLADKLHIPRRQYNSPGVRHWRYDRFRAVSLQNLHPVFNPTKKKKTVEFRQHAGTLDAFEILRWIVTVCALVQIAHDSSEEDFLDIIQRHTRPDGTDNEDVGLLEVFESFGIGFLAPLWRDHLLSHKLTDRDCRFSAIRDLMGRMTGITRTSVCLRSLRALGSGFWRHCGETIYSRIRLTDRDYRVAI